MSEELKPYQNLSLEDILSEKWEDIVDFEGIYQVSNFGRIKSLERKVWRESQQVYVKVRERILRQNFKKKTGHCMVRLQHLESNMTKHPSVSTLVAKNFISNPSGARYVFHKDLDVSNNVVSNLFWSDENYLSDMQKKIKDRKLSTKDNKEEFSLYKGVTKWTYFKMQIQNKEKGIKISEIFEDELDAAKKYDYWIKKYNLKRTGNFINKQTT